MAEGNVLDARAAVRHLARTDRRMRALIAAHGPPPFRRKPRSFAILGRSIIYQQLSPKAADAIYARFVAAFPRRCFPSPERLLAVPLGELRALGLSNQKAGYLRDLAEKFRDGTVRPRRFRSASDDKIAEMLLEVRGIGPWSVDMFLVFGLARPDVLPTGDLGVRKGMRCFFDLDELPEPEEMVRLAEPWRPYRTAGSWYMWRCAESGLP